MKYDLDTIAREVVGQVAHHVFWLNQRLYWGGINPPPPSQADPYQSSPLLEELRLLVRVANGEIDRARASEELRGEVYETLQSTVELLFAPIGASAYEIPPDFWAWPGIGQVCGQVVVWLHGDDLISYTEAARLLYDDAASVSDNALQMRISRLIDDGRLGAYSDPDEPNPRHAQRVLRSEVERLREMR